MSRSATSEVPYSVLVAPKTVFIAEIAPRRHLAEFSLELANFPGTLRAATEILSKHNVNILSGFHDAARWSFFADLTETRASTEQLVQELKGLKVVTNVNTQEAPSGILVDCLHYPLIWGKHKAIMIRADTLSSILDRIRAMFGKEGLVAKVMLFAMGEAAGRESFEMMAGEVGANTVKKELTNATNLYSACGWGIFKVISVNFERGSAIVQALDCFECAPYKDTGSTPYSQFIRGHIAGLFSELFGRRIDIVETHCIARGEPYCQFRIEPAEGNARS